MTASNPLAEARTTPLSRRSAQAVPNRYHRRERIGQRDHPGPGLRLPRPVRYSTRTTIGRSCHDKSCTEWPEHTRTTLRDSTPNPSASVTFLVCNRPQQQARPLHSFFFVFFSLLRQQTPTCFRDHVSFLPTECASVRCHNYNADGRHPSQVDSYQQSIRPFKQ